VESSRGGCDVIPTCDVGAVQVWVERWKERKQKESGEQVARLPSGFPPANQLPPSLQPPPPPESGVAVEGEEVEWGWT